MLPEGFYSSKDYLLQHEEELSAITPLSTLFLGVYPAGSACGMRLCVNLLLYSAISNPKVVVLLLFQ
jgi:hypothetical protein